MKKINITICSGGTGGHLFPAKATIERLLNCNTKDRHINISVVTDKRSLTYMEDLINKVYIKDIKTLQFSGKRLFYKIKALLFISIGVLQTVYYFIKERPKVVVTFGGYTSVPVLIACVLLRINFILHEQNSIVGKANHLFIKFAKLICVSFKPTLRLEEYEHKAKYVGLPVREDFFKLANNAHINNRNITIKANISRKYTLAILGGSQGAKIFGSFIPKAFGLLTKDLQSQLTVYHQCREEIIRDVTREWQKTNVDFHIKKFFNNVPQIFLSSQLVIARSGAATIAEINCMGKAAIYIPFKEAILNHQEYNAMYMVNLGAAEIIKEDKLDTNNFNKIITNLLSNPNKIKQMEQIAKNSCNNKASKDFANLIIECSE